MITGFEKFTDRARKAMQLANQFAQVMNYDHIGSDCVLMGIVQESGGIAAAVLRGLGIDLRSIRLEVTKAHETHTEYRDGRSYFVGSKDIINAAINESRNRGMSCVGTEDLLVGLLLVQRGLAFDVLTKMGVTLELMRTEIDRFVKQLQGTVLFDLLEMTSKADEVIHSELGEMHSSELRNLYCRLVGWIDSIDISGDPDLYFCGRQAREAVWYLSEIQHRKELKQREVGKNRL